MERNDCDYLAGILVGVFLADLIDDHLDKITDWFRSRYDRFVQDIAKAIKDAE